MMMNDLENQVRYDPTTGEIQSIPSKTDTFETGSKCPFQGGVRLIEVSVKRESTVLEIYDPPTGKTDAISRQHDVDYSACKDDRKCKIKQIEKW